MAAKEKASAGPTSMAGLVRYYEQERSLIELKPEHVIWICVGIFVLEVILLLGFRL